MGDSYAKIVHFAASVHEYSGSDHLTRGTAIHPFSASQDLFAAKSPHSLLGI